MKGGTSPSDPKLKVIKGPNAPELNWVGVLLQVPVPG
jgi:hypothetical protein